MLGDGSALGLALLDLATLPDRTSAACSLAPWLASIPPDLWATAELAPALAAARAVVPDVVDLARLLCGRKAAPLKLLGKSGVAVLDDGAVQDVERFFDVSAAPNPALREYQRSNVSLHMWMPRAISALGASSSSSKTASRPAHVSADAESVHTALALHLAHGAVAFLQADLAAHPLALRSTLPAASHVAAASELPVDLAAMSLADVMAAAGVLAKSIPEVIELLASAGCTNGAQVIPNSKLHSCFHL